MKSAASGLVGLAAAVSACVHFANAAAASDTQTQKLLLAMSVNGQPSHVIAEVVERDGAISINAVDLAAAGIKFRASEINADGWVSLAALMGVQARVLGPEQELHIIADQHRLAPQHFDLGPPQSPRVTAAGTGFVGEYDLAASVDDFGHPGKTDSLGATLAGTFFTPYGALRANGFAQDQAGSSQFVRFDTAAEYDDEDTMRRWTLGDAISGGLDWSRSVRFAGLQIATDFSLQPDRATMPLPSFFGQTAVPGTLDVFIDSAHVFENNLQPGPFQIDNLPVVTGSGQASIVVRNVLGQETTAVLPFFASSELLQPGLSSYDLDLGTLRRNYGLASFDYGEPALAGTFSMGATNWMTLETHGEATKDVQLLGGGAIFALGAYGSLQAAAAASSSNDGGIRDTGMLYSLSLKTQSYPIGFFVSATATSGGYEDVASIDGIAPPRLQMQLGANLNIAGEGSLAASWIDVRRKDQNSSLASLSYTLPVANRWYIGATSLYDCTNRVWTTEALLSVSLDGNLIAGASVRSGTHDQMQEADLTAAADPDGGFGYRVSASTGDDDIGQAEATWIGSHGSIDAGVSSVNGTVAGRLLASGAVIAMDGSLYASQVPNGAVALVHTGQEDVRVFRENRQVATSDENGDALVTGLVPYTENRISIDPRDYDFSTIIDTTDEIVIPRRSSGVVVNLAPASHSPALIILHWRNGSPPPAGSTVVLSGISDPLVVGRDGEIFIADFPRPVKGTVEYGEASCHFEVSPPAVPARDSIARIGPVLCAKDEAS